MDRITIETGRTCHPSLWRPGRAGHRIRGFTIHHWGAGRRLDFDGIVSFLVGPHTPKSSAHYVAQGSNQDGEYDPRIACIVDPDDTAYHAGNWTANLTRIGIECRPYPTGDDYAAVAQLVRRLRVTYGDLPLDPHNRWTATACPGEWDLARLDRLARQPASTPPKPAPPKPSTPATAPPEDDMPLSPTDLQAIGDLVTAAVRTEVRRELDSIETTRTVWTRHPLVKDPGDTGDERVTPSTLLELVAAAVAAELEHW